MKYEHIKKAAFQERPNRFIAYADLLEPGLAPQRVKCHVRNTGRCRELLLPGAEAVLQHHPGALLSGRKTEYSLIGVYKDMPYGRELVNLDSQAPNRVAWEWLEKGGLADCLAAASPSAHRPIITEIRREVPYGDSRFDLAFQQDGEAAFMEVKGVTLEEHGTARFPDAPTERGVKHLRGLTEAASRGYRAYALFVIAMKGVSRFEPNRKTHPAFADALLEAAQSGVKILAFDCLAAPDSLNLDQPVDIRLI